MSYEIFTDSSSNLTDDLLSLHQIHMISYTLDFDGRDFLCYEKNRNHEEIGRQFYGAMRNGKTATSSLINSSLFIEHFEPFLKQGKDILFISISSGISGTYQAALLAANELSEKYPLRQVIVLDSLAASLGEGLLVLELAKLRKEGKSLSEVTDYFYESRATLNQYFTVDDLTYLKKGGRISRIEATLGNLLSIKPLLRGNADGKIVFWGKARTRKKALDSIVELVQNRITNPEKQTIALSHCDAPEEAGYLAEKIKELCHVKEVLVRYYDFCTGSHVGPGTIAVFFHGKHPGL